ncbi:MAG: helix-turn-helix transcriptional regulator [Proteiniphilum sp.]|uniref:helix-turn-helix domain-containing protein n=1 Tax=Proteiniphilum sp. TaxID=1926877 RepID=UPI002ABAA21F|nr:helix-turn-helix transcriptional regulator [Proteiniphilum sp.]MDY9919654.1 helix-turn-helix transcriptional regulator [Proteiniphilum sp.]
METKEQIFRNTHHGHAVKRIRHTLGIKQEVLADMMGTTQARISNSEQKKVLEDEMIDKFAKALNVAPEFIKELEEDPVTFIIENNTFEKGSMAGIYNVGDFINNPDPVDRFIELSKEKTALYERIVELEKEKNALLEKLLKEKE